MRFERVFMMPVAVRNWFKESPGEALIESLKEWMADETKQLEGSNDPVRLYNAQGSIKVLRRLIELPEELKQYQKGVREGKIKPIS